MKRYLIFLSLCLAFSWGCDDFLTVKPKSVIKQDELLSTPEGVEDAMYGLYSKLAEGNLYGRQLTYVVPELLAQSYKVDVGSGGWGQTGEMIGSYQHTGKYAREMYNPCWIRMYEAIGFVNNLITALEQKDPANFRHLNYYLGESLGLRAFVHFDVLRLFAPHISSPDAQGIPYVRYWTPAVTPFSKVRDVYAAILADLKRSELYLMEAEKDYKDEKDIFLTHRELHFNIDAARATLARVYWMKGDMDSAYLYARKVIDTDKYRMSDQTEVPDMFARVINKKETIWGLSTVDPTETLVKDFYDKDANCIPRAGTTLLYQAGKEDDKRVAWFRTVSGDSEQVHFLKFFHEKGYNANWKDKDFEKELGAVPGINILRLSEMYLIAAETLLEKDPEMAREYFDMQITARGWIAFKTRGKPVTLQDINDERYREFWGEGYEWYNMKRQNRDLHIILDNTDVPGNDRMYTLPVPDEEWEYREEKNEGLY